MKSRILLIVSISVFLVLYYTKDGRACFPYPLEYNECRFGLFVPYSTQLRAYDGMYFSYFNVHDITNEKGVEADRQLNVGEWYKYMDGKVDRQSIYTLLYHTEPVVFAEALIDTLSSRSFSKNAFFRYLIMPEHKKLLDYMTLAKRGENFTRVDPLDPWENDHQPDLRIADLKKPITDGIANTGNDNFLKARYLYLDIRYSFYFSAENKEDLYPYAEIEEHYKQLQDLPIKSVVKAWAAYFNARSVWFRNKAKANYLLAQAFNMSDDKKMIIYKEFSSDLFGASSCYVRNNHELANLYSLVAMNRAGKAVSYIEKVYQLDPANPNLSFLMVREISKLEDRIFTPKYTGFDAQVRPGYSVYDYETRHMDFETTDMLYLASWKAFLTAALADSIPKDKFFFNLCMAHTCLLDGKPADAKTYLAEAKKYLCTDTELLCQYRLTDLAATVNGATELDSKFENQIAPTLVWLEKNRDHLENSTLVLKQAHLMISKKYEEVGNISRAILTRSRYDWYTVYPHVACGFYFNISTTLYQYIQENTSGAEAEAFVNTLKKKNKTPFEKFYAEPVDTSRSAFNAVCDAAGSDYLREGDYTGALRMFSQIDDSYWLKDHAGEVLREYLNADPFIAHPIDNHARSQALDSTQKYNKKTFARRLVGLINKDSNNPDSLIRIADAMYNMTYHGNAWILVRNSWSAYDDVFDKRNWRDPNTMSPRYYDYYVCGRAKQWYQKAYYSSKDKEIKAKALLMMAQCDLNYSLATSPRKKQHNTYLFDRFASEYAETRYYQDLTSLCEIGEVKDNFYHWFPLSRW